MNGLKKEKSEISLFEVDGLVFIDVVINFPYKKLCHKTSVIIRIIIVLKVC